MSIRDHSTQFFAGRMVYGTNPQWLAALMFVVFCAVYVFQGRVPPIPEIPETDTDNRPLMHVRYLGWVILQRFDDGRLLVDYYRTDEEREKAP